MNGRRNTKWYMYSISLSVWAYILYSSYVELDSIPIIVQMVYNKKYT